MRPLLFVIGLTITLQASCQNNKNNPSKTGEKEVKELKTNTINNAGKAKRPAGKISFKIDGKSVTTPDHQNQCMIVGMGHDYGQYMVSGGKTISIIYVGKPAIGEIIVKKTAGLPNLGMQILDGNIAYSNMHGGNISMEITKMVKDGDNYYIAGKFSGILKDQNRSKSITVTEGIFESAYVN
jgi:hypothetical protein